VVKPKPDVRETTNTGTEGASSAALDQSGEKRK